MITLFRMIRLWQLKTKWKLALMQFIDKQAGEALKDPASLEKRLTSVLVELLHGEAQNTEQ